MDIQVIEKDIRNMPKNYIIIHQVNCIGQAKSGVVLSIFEECIKARAEYDRVCLIHKNNIEGILGLCQVVKDDTGRTVVNLFSQLSNKTMRPDIKIHTNYEAMKIGLESLVRKIRDEQAITVGDRGIEFALPWNIGAVRGGGDMKVIYKIIKETLSPVGNITFCCYSPQDYVKIDEKEYEGLVKRSM